jgi:ribosomal protein S18 acetylase RimI-like enzyme
VIDYRILANAIDSETIAEMARVVEACFGVEWTDGFAGRVEEKRNPCVVLAREDGDPVGFKLGYERGREEFYSWLGGVLPRHRRRGVAAEMMKLQHEWCRKNGYRFVVTDTLNDNAAMLILNLRSGFRIVGTRLDERGLKVVLSCRL